MAKITPGAIISEISGSIANVTYSRSKYGMYSKAKLNQTNPDTPAQQAARAIAAAATAAWQALAPEEQAAWNQFAVSQLSKPRLSLRSTLNGYNAFIRFYITRNTYGLTGNPERVNEQPIGTYSGFSMVVTGSAINLTLVGNNTNPDIFAVARLSGPRSPGQSTITQSMIVNMDFQQAPNGSLTFNLLSAWEAKWGPLSGSGGQKIFGQIDIVNRVTAQKVTVFRGSGVAVLGIATIIGCTDGAADALISSIDDITWTPRTTPAPDSFTAVCYSPTLGIWCAIANTISTGEVYLSSDGVTWVQQTTISMAAVISVAYCVALGLFIACESNLAANGIMTSPDGVNWTRRTAPAGISWTDIAINEAAPLIVITDFDNTGNDVITSPDGINWTQQTTPGPQSWAGITYAPSLGLFIASNFDGTTNGIMTSPDGVTWTLRTTPGGMTLGYGAWSESLTLCVFMAFDGSGNDFMTSPDGINWTQRASPAGKVLADICWDEQNQLFVAVSTDSTSTDVMTSPDGINWTLRSSPAGRTLSQVNSKP